MCEFYVVIERKHRVLCCTLAFAGKALLHALIWSQVRIILAKPAVDNASFVVSLRILDQKCVFALCAVQVHETKFLQLRLTGYLRARWRLACYSLGGQ